MSICLRRREFVAALGPAIALPLAARAQQRALPVVGFVSVSTAAATPEREVAFRQGLGEAGYSDGRNGTVEYHFLLKRAAIMFNPDTFPVSTYVPSFETAARSLKVTPIITPVHSEVELETAIIALGREPGGGLVVMPDVFTIAHRASIISAAARNNVPAVYATSYWARDGGLLSYGIDLVDSWRRAASYVDRILRGEKPGDLPVQFPTKFEMILNRKTATALGLAIPPSILLRATEVIE
jgi:hypothetical protein